MLGSSTNEDTFYLTSKTAYSQTQIFACSEITQQSLQLEEMLNIIIYQQGADEKNSIKKLKPFQSLAQQTRKVLYSSH